VAIITLSITPPVAAHLPSDYLVLNMPKKIFSRNALRLEQM
jgi:hypothetical protein